MMSCGDIVPQTAMVCGGIYPQHCIFAAKIQKVSERYKSLGQRADDFVAEEGKNRRETRGGRSKG